MRMNDLELISAIREATKDGGHAEVKKRDDGTFVVYKVKKKIVTSGK